MIGIGCCRIKLQHVLPRLPRSLPVATLLFGLFKDFPRRHVAPVMVQRHAKVGNRAIGVRRGKTGLCAVTPQHLLIRLQQQGIIHVLYRIQRALGIKVILCALEQQIGGGGKILLPHPFDPDQQVTRTTDVSGMRQFSFQIHQRRFSVRLAPVMGMDACGSGACVLVHPV